MEKGAGVEKGGGGKRRKKLFNIPGVKAQRFAHEVEIELLLWVLPRCLKLATSMEQLQMLI